MSESEFVLHINFEEIKSEADKLHGVSKEVREKIDSFLTSLKKTTNRVEPTLSKETEDERELWEDYRQLQREKLAVLDLSHEWDFVGEKVQDANPRLDLLVRDAIEELNDHISVLAESHRAHIDILEIYYTRKIEALALVITVVISYLAVWEFFVHDLLVSVVFPYGLSPRLNDLLVVLSLLPVFVTAGWAWVRRKRYF